MLKYNYAFDNQGNVISIVDVPEEGHLEKDFFCIGCGGPMVAAIGPKRRYFRHKADEPNCNKESYLHQLAKLRIKQRFDDFTKPFEISLPGLLTCEKNCSLYKEDTCTSHGYQKPIDLHEYYDTCEIEKGIDGYVADLLLTSSSVPHRKPILIEIYVKHKCTEDKINSGHKIIELPVNSEETIEQYCRCAIRATFYGFNPPPQKKAWHERLKCEIDLESFRGAWLKRFVLYPSKKFILKEIRCFEKEKPFPQNSLLQLNIYRDLWHGIHPLEIAHYLKRKHGIELRACSLCRYFWVDRYETIHCNQHSDDYRFSEYTAFECPKYEMKWLRILYKRLTDEERLKDEEIEIIVPYTKESP